MLNGVSPFLGKIQRVTYIFILECVKKSSSRKLNLTNLSIQAKDYFVFILYWINNWFVARSPRGVLRGSDLWRCFGWLPRVLGLSSTSRKKDLQPPTLESDNPPVDLSRTLLPGHSLRDSEVLTFPPSDAGRHLPLIPGNTEIKWDASQIRSKFV